MSKGSALVFFAVSAICWGVGLTLLMSLGLFPIPSKQAAGVFVLGLVLSVSGLMMLAKLAESGNV